MLSFEHLKFTKTLLFLGDTRGEPSSISAVQAEPSCSSDGEGDSNSNTRLSNSLGGVDSCGICLRRTTSIPPGVHQVVPENRMGNDNDAPAANQSKQK